MASFRIHEDLENVAHFKRKNKNTTVPAYQKGEVQKKKCLQENRNVLKPLNQEPRHETKRQKLTSSENEVCQIKIEKVETVKILEEKIEEIELIEEDKENAKPVNVEETDSFPVSLLYNFEYRTDIFQYLRECELTCQRVKPGYMSKQADLSSEIRSILIDWLASVTDEYGFRGQTFHLGVNYIDRFLSYISVVKEKFQLVGAAAMMLAGKVEEIYPIDTREWAYLTGDAFTTRQLHRMEQLILKVLKFGMEPPTMYTFIQHLCSYYNLDAKTRHLAFYLSELVLMEGDDYMEHVPSKLAAASIVLARHTLVKGKVWPQQLKAASGYSLKQLSPVVQKQHRTFKNSPMKKQQAIQNKYRSEKYNKVALLKPRSLDLEEFHEADD